MSGYENVIGLLRGGPTEQDRAAIRSRIHTYIISQRKVAEEARLEYVQNAMNTKHFIEEANRKIETLQQEYNAILTACDEKRREISASETEDEVLTAQKLKSDATLNELFQATQQENDKLQQLTQALDEQMNEHNRQLKDLREGIALYERLGMSIVKSKDGTLKIQFTHIDPNDPTKVFSFHLSIDSISDAFIATNCNPPIANLKILLQETNDSGNLPRFIRAMRREFQSLVLKE